MLTAGLLVIWAYTWTIGLPFDESPHVEPTDAVSMAVEILLLIGLLCLAYPQMAPKGR